MPISHQWRVAAAALLLPLALAACSSTPSNSTLPATAPAKPAAAASPTSSPSPTGEPKTYDGVKAAVDRIDGAAKANDGGASWDLMTAAGQATMSRADYLKVTQGCPKLIASSTVLSIALDTGGNTAAVKISAPPAQGGQPYEYRMIYEAGHWKRQPSDGAMGWMGLGADKALTVLRDGGVC